jgi:predicted GIY-YIG superfamily endonuclease
MAWFVYLVRCRDGSLYTGTTTDPAARLRAHNTGRGARYTRGRRPVALVHVEPAVGRAAALRREWIIKQWPRARKDRLLAAAARRRRRTSEHHADRRPRTGRAQRNSE